MRSSACVTTRAGGGGGAGQAESEGKDRLHRQKMTMKCRADGGAEEGVLNRLRLGAERAAQGGRGAWGGVLAEEEAVGGGVWREGEEPNFASAFWRLPGYVVVETLSFSWN